MPWARLLPYLLGGAAILALLAWIAASAHEAGVTARKRDAGELLERITDKAAIWSEVVNGRASLDEWMKRFDAIMGASEEERAAFRTELSVSRAQVQTSRDQAKAMLKELDDARSKVEVAWKDGRIPAGINCRVLHAPGCAAIPDAAAGAARAGADGLSGAPAGGDAGRPAPLLSAGPADRRLDGRSAQ